MKRAMITLGAALAALASLVLVPTAGASPAQTVRSWGDFGEQGPVSPIQPSPTEIDGVPGTIVQVVATNAATYALNGSGEVWAFGANDLGELGNGTTTSSFSTPVQVDLPPIAWLPSPMPYATGMAVATDGTAYGWGANEQGELCVGTDPTITTPVQLPFVGVTAATGAGGHASYYASGQLYSCGQNQFGQLGIGNTNGGITSPKKVSLARHAATTAGVSTLVSGYGFTGALLSDGSYEDWGLNARGQLGIGTTTNESTPQVVSFGSAVSFVTIGANTANDGQSFVMLANGKIKAWGADQFAQLCDGQETDGVLSPETLTPPEPLSTIASGGGSSYLLGSTGNLWACGDNRDGEIGDGATGAPVVSPVEVLTGVSMVSATSRNEIAVTG